MIQVDRLRTFALAVFVAPAALGAQQEVVLHEPAGAIEGVFSSINGLAELSDGRFLVSDGTGQALIRVDMRSGTQDTLGGIGEGPDEYRGPDVLLRMPGDSVLLTDLGNGRLTVIHPDGRFGRTEPIARERAGSFSMLIPRGGDSQGRIYFADVAPTPGGGMPSEGRIARWNPYSESMDVLGQFQLPAVNTRSSGGPNSQQQETRPVPLSPQDAWTVLPDGRVAIAKAAEYRVDWISADGRVSQGRVNNVTPRRVTAQDQEAWIDDLQNALGVEMEVGPSGRRMTFSRGGRGGRPSASEFEWPERMPVFEGIVADPMGYAWVQRYERPGDDATYDVFDSNGRLVAQVKLAPGREIIAVTNRRVYAQVEDDMGLVTLEMHRRPSF